MTDRGRARAPFPLITHHVLLRAARRVREVDDIMAGALTAGRLEQIVDLIPEVWLEDGAAQRAAYRTYLGDRLAAPRAFVEEAVGAR